jgi:hypothetical protein
MSPRKQAAKSYAATSTTSPHPQTGNMASAALASAAWRCIGGALMPGHRAVMVMLLPCHSSASNSASDLVSDNT